VKNQDKHKPLSSDELMKLLDEQSDTEINFDDMDDFEKDALEGFSMHSTPEKAKALIKEMNASISEKVADEKGGQKSRIIWFSAAASIVVIVMISIFFFNKSKNETNLALNDNSVEDYKMPTDVMPSGEEMVTGRNDQIKSPDNSLITVSKNSKPETLQEKSLETAANGPAYGGVIDEVAKVSKSAKGNLFSDGDQNQEQKNGLTDNFDDQKKEILASSESIAANDLSIAQKSTSVPSATGYSKDANRKEDAETIVKEESNKEKAKKYSNDNVDELSTVSKSAPVSLSENKINQSAYYTGGETAIKDFVVNYFKEHSSSTLLKGKYKVIGYVNVKGELKVTSITQITKNFCDGCTDKMKEALNTMKNWNSSSVVEFTLDF
jgi:hypothetical protein